jgi:hypothetical protein
MMVLGGLAAGALKIPSEKSPAALSKLLVLVQTHAWWFVLVASVVGVVAKATADILGPPWVRQALQRIINRFRKHAFVNILDGEPHHDHRVTLFQRKGFWFPIAIPFLANGQRWPIWPSQNPWSGWMVPVARTGRATLATRTCFLATDDPSKSEGIVGEVWLSNSVTVRMLPELGEKPSEQKIAAYAKAAKVSKEWIRSRVNAGKACPLALCGIPIEVGNKFWGVLVLDSSRQNTIDYQGHGWKAFTDMVQSSLEELLKRI